MCEMRQKPWKELHYRENERNKETQQQESTSGGNASKCLLMKLKSCFREINGKVNKYILKGRKTCLTSSDIF